jgi:hypothetical protein
MDGLLWAALVFKGISKWKMHRFNLILAPLEEDLVS